MLDANFIDAAVDLAAKTERPPYTVAINGHVVGKLPCLWQVRRCLHGHAMLMENDLLRLHPDLA